MINKDKLEKLMEETTVFIRNKDRGDDCIENLIEVDRKEEKRHEDLDYLEECKSDKDDWDMSNKDYL